MLNPMRDDENQRPPVVIFGLLSLYLLKSDPGSHSRLFVPLLMLHTRARAFHFYREKASALSSFVDSSRAVQ